MLELVPDLVDRALDRRLRRHVLRRRPDREVVEPREDLAGQRVEMRDLLDLVAEERDAVRGLLVRRLHLDDVALDTEAAAPEHRVVPHVLRVDQLAQDEVAVVLLPHLEVDHPLAPFLRGAESVDARHRGDDDHVPACEERRGGGEPETRDVVVLGRVLLDVQVGLGHVRLGLVVVVVGDEILDRVVREELAELVAELRGERLVVRDDQRRLLDLLDDPGHRRRLPGPGRAEQRLVALTGAEAVRELPDRARLVAGRPVVGGCFERGHFRDRVAAVPERPEHPPHAAYAQIVATFAGGLAAAGGLARLLDRDPRCDTPLDLVVLAGATFKAARTIARDDVTSFVRDPFVEGEAGTGDEEQPKQTGGMEQAIGELVTCTRCVGTWAAAGLTATQIIAPRFGRMLTWTLAAAAANDFLQAGFAALAHKSNELEKRTD
jgi:hypothetical protein